MVAEVTTTDLPPLPSLRDALAGRRILVTGATGFLGTALVERLLRCIPECQVVVLIRPTRRADAAARLAREVVRNDCFDRLRAELGERFAAEIAERLHAVSGDVGREGLGLDDADRQVLASCDVVVHSAATVAFDAPLDSAVEVNLLGPSRVAGAIESVADSRRRDHPDGAPTHMVTVSTAYVAGTHEGDATETLATVAMASGARARTHTTVTTEVDIDAEVTAARRLRADLEASSRSPELLTRFTKAARSELGAAGRHLLAERAEKLRDDWVRTQLVERGPGPRPSARVARRLRLHQGAGRAGPRHSAPGYAHHLRTALDHRVGSGRAPARVDPRLPHGRAHHRLLRPGAAAASSPASPRA